MKLDGVPAMSLAAFTAGEVLFADTVGVTQFGGHRPITPRTIFQAGSISKMVTAFAALRLVDAGQLSLDTDVNERLVEWKVPASGSWQPHITLRQLLSHTAGTAVHGFMGYRRGDTIPGVSDILYGRSPTKNLPIRVDRLPGTGFRYSGGGTMIVQRLIMDVTDREFQATMRELVFDPLDMANSSFSQPDLANDRADVACGHWYAEDKVKGGWCIHPESAAAGLWSTPTDLARLAMSIHSSFHGRHSGILSPALAKEMLQVQPPSPFGLGVSLSGSAQTRRFGHSGDTFGFVADLTCLAESGQGVAIMANSITASSAMHSMTAAIAVAHSWPSADTVDLDNAIRLPALSSIVGNYQLADGPTVELRVDGDGLTLRLAGQAPLRLRGRDAWTLSAWDVDLQLRVARGSEDAQALQLQQGEVIIDVIRMR
jgi:CubicO group peptidase (beta-lactamase class C family)